MRPRYVTPANVENEKRVLRRLATQLGGFSHPAEKGCPFDGWIEKSGQIEAIVEVKGRTGSGQRFETWHLALDKVKTLLVWGEINACQVILVFTWEDGDYALHLDPGTVDLRQYRVTTGGRYDRNDSHDVEQMIHFPKDSFKKIA